MEGKRALGTAARVAAAALAFLLMAGLALAQEPQSAPLGTAFTYQGQLKVSDAPYTGTCDVKFGLYDALTGGTQVGILTKTAMPVAEGLFTVQLDYGTGKFEGDARWLEMSVRCPSGSGTYQILSPRQALTAAPYALHSKGAPWSGLSGVPAGFADGTDNDTTYSAGTGLTLSGTTFSANTTYLQRRVSGSCTTGSAIRVVNADGTVTCQAVSGGGWSLTGNAGTTPGTNYLGTSDSEALEIKVNAARVLRFEPNASSPNLVGGYSGNWLTSGVYGATIGGGGEASYLNRVTDNLSTVGGGANNQAGDNTGTVADANYATVGGGISNNASGPHSTVGGGWSNIAGDISATVGGGYSNEAGAYCATVGGGDDNSAGGSRSTVGGGWGNAASGDYATVPGGFLNSAGGLSSFAAGYRAKAPTSGSFVWADKQESDYIATGANTFNVRAQNGANIDAANSGYGLKVDNDAGGSIEAYANVSSGYAYGGVYTYNTGTSPGIYAESAGTYAGVFAGQIFTGGCVGCVLIQLGQSDGAGALEPGDLAAVSGLGEPLAGTNQPILRVHRAAPGEAVIGVVQARGVRAQAQRDGQTIESVDLAEGEIQAGDHLFLVVYGPAQVKADASSGPIAAGMRLAAGGQPGHARALRTVMVDGLTVAEAAPGVGTALEPLDSGAGLIAVFVTLD
jgi:hypothetical protein